MKIPYIIVMVVCACLIVGAGCRKTTPVKAPVFYKSLAAVIGDNPSLTIFKTAIQKSGFDKTLTGLDSLYTIFAPTDSAFMAIGLTADSIGRMQPGDLISLLRYHIAAGNFPNESFPKTMVGTLIMSDTLAAFVNWYDYNSPVSINGAFLDSADIQAQNGVLHIIRQVLNIPSKTLLQTIDQDPDLSYLRAAFRVLGWDDAYFTSVAPATVLAPTNEAFIAKGFGDSTQFASQTSMLNSALGASVSYYRLSFPAKGVTISANDGSFIDVTGTEGAFRLNVVNSTRSAGFVAVNRLCKDGLLHKIDNFLGN